MLRVVLVLCRMIVEMVVSRLMVFMVMVELRVALRRWCKHERLRLGRLSFLAFSATDLNGQVLYEAECLPPLMTHQAYGRVLNDFV